RAPLKISYNTTIKTKLARKVTFQEVQEKRPKVWTLWQFAVCEHGGFLTNISSSRSPDSNKDSGSSSKSNNVTAFESAELEPPRMPPIRRTNYFPIDCEQNAAPEKRQRVPSAYNRFIKEEIQRIKASNPDISHREAFSTAAKNWAHFPHIHFGLKLDSNKHAKLDHQSFAGEGTQKTNELYEINGTLRKSNGKELLPASGSVEAETAEKQGEERREKERPDFNFYHEPSASQPQGKCFDKES
ncbi:unnamed protein product, partial [Dovyalis caffra]